MYASVRSGQVFSHLSVLHDKDSVRIHDGIEPVGDGEHRTPGKFVTYGLLLSTTPGVMRNREQGGAARSGAETAVGGTEKCENILLP